MVKMRRTTRDEKIVNPGVYEVPEFECPRCGHCCPEREWVWLTDTQIDEIMRPLTQNQPYSWRVFARAIEAKLKEKNQ
jgi:Fe-S-cluster containining protein